MHTQINILAQSEGGMLPRQGNSITFQKDKSIQEFLEYSLAKTTMNYAHIANLGTGLRNPLNECAEEFVRLNL